MIVVAVVVGSHVEYREQRSQHGRRGGVLRGLGLGMGSDTVEHARQQRGVALETKHCIDELAASNGVISLLR